jgi:sRNA-binding carbon storage regulator CsrA
MSCRINCVRCDVVLETKKQLQYGYCFNCYFIKNYFTEEKIFEYWSLKLETIADKKNGLKEWTNNLQELCKKENPGLFIEDDKDTNILKTKKKLVWIRITKPDEVPITKWLKEISLIKNNVHFPECQYALEASQFSDNQYKNIHCHILSKKQVGFNEKKYKDYINKYISVFNQYVFYQDFPETMYDDKVEYLKGNKWDPEKDLSTEITKQFRLKNNIQNIY